MNTVLAKAEGAQKDILYRLLQYSLFEESIHDQNEMTEAALFAYPWFDAYFTEKDREAFFIREQETGKLLGFAMINAYLQKFKTGRSIGEFMVLPKYRRNRIGKKAALMCFGLHPGNWEVSPSFGSRQSYLFWKHVIDGYTGGNSQFADGIFLFSNEQGSSRKDMPGSS